MSEILLKLVDEIGSFLEQFEAFIVGLSGGTNVLFVGLMIVSLIGLIAYFITQSIQITYHK